MSVSQIVKEALATGDKVQQAKEAGEQETTPVEPAVEAPGLDGLQESLRKQAEDLEGDRPDASTADEPAADQPTPQTEGQPEIGPDVVPTPEPGPPSEDPEVSAGDEPAPDQPAPQTGDGETPAEVGPDHVDKTAQEALAKTAERVAEYLLTTDALREVFAKSAGFGRGAAAAGAGLMGMLGGGIAGHQVAQGDDDDKMQAAYMAGVDDLAQALLGEQVAGAQGAAF